MESSTKKGLLIVGGVLIIGGVIAWLYNKNKKATSLTPSLPSSSGAIQMPSSTPRSNSYTPTSSGGPAAPLSASDTTDFQKFANSKGYSPSLAVDGVFGPKTSTAWKKFGADWKKSKSGINTGVSQIKLVKANDVLSGNINAINGKAIYATADGVGIYNMSDVKSSQTTKNQYLGVASYATPSSNGAFSVFFITNNTKYWIPSDYVNVKM